MRPISYSSCGHSKCNADLTKRGTRRKRCAGCHSVFYDSVLCQKKDWPIHKTECKEQQDRFIAIVRYQWPEVDTMAKLLARPEVCGFIARLYFYGRGGFEQNNGMSVFWMLQWVKGGDPAAMMSLGSFYLEGDVVPMDKRKGFQLYKSAADLGDPLAQRRVGSYYWFGGDGVDVDQEEALRWYRLSADQGDATSQHQLGKALEFGNGVEKDLQKALVWLRKAAEQGGSGEQSDLGHALMHRSRSPTDAAAVESVKWFRKSAEQGRAEAQYMLGNLLKSGNGISPDPIEAVSWYRKGANQGYAGAQFELAMFYVDGPAVTDEQFDQALKLFHLSADQGFDQAKEFLAVLAEESGLEPHEVEETMYM